MPWEQRNKHLTTGDIAELCGVNYRTVIRWIHTDLLVAYQLPGTRGDNRVLMRDFLEFLRNHRVPLPSELQPYSRRVLVVEDEAPMAKAIKRALERKNYEVMVAPDGFLAGALAATFSPAVITLDLKMPGLSGMDVLKAIRNDPELAAIKIIVVSAMPEKELQAALDAGADDILEKPFKNTDLVDKVARFADAGPRV
ncbi:MAG: response regulator [Thermoanaerobaculales bacterium]|nr:response regulator [Thermoanaerobaculales bacterium]